MNLQRLRLFLLSLCVCLSVLCSSSHIAHATESENNSNFIFTVNGQSDYYIDSSQVVMPLGDEEYVPYSNIIHRDSLPYVNGVAKSGSLWDGNFYAVSPNNTYKFVYKAMLTKSYDSGTFDVSFVVPSSANVNITGASFQFRDMDGNGIFSLVSNSNVTYSPPNSNTNEAGYYTITFSDVTCSSDIWGFRLEISFYVDSQISLAMYPMQIELDYEDESKGLLGSIIEIVRNIFTGITNLPGNIANSIKGFFDNIVNSLVNMMNVLTNALTSLGNFLIDGIKSLFVPSSEELQSYFDNWKQLLSDRFGALYEVFDIIISYFQSFSNTASTVGADSSITFPSVSIPLAGTNFVFGGWEVNLIPAGFTIIFDALKLMINVVCTIAFVNSLRRRYDRVVEK